VTYTYHALGRLSGVYQGAGLATPLASFAYNSQGLPQSRTEGPGSSLAYGYDAIGRLTSIADAFNWSPANGTLTFTHNPAGQIGAAARPTTAMPRSASACRIAAQYYRFWLHPHDPKWR